LLLSSFEFLVVDSARHQSQVVEKKGIILPVPQQITWAKQCNLVVDQLLTFLVHVGAALMELRWPEPVYLLNF